MIFIVYEYTTDEFKKLGHVRFFTGKTIKIIDSGAKSNNLINNILKQKSIINNVYLINEQFQV